MEEDPMIAILLAATSTVCLQYETRYEIDQCRMEGVTFCGSSECSSDTEYTEHLKKTLEGTNIDVGSYFLRRCTFKKQTVCVLEMKTEKI